MCAGISASVLPATLFPVGRPPVWKTAQNVSLIPLSSSCKGLNIRLKDHQAVLGDFDLIAQAGVSYLSRHLIQRNRGYYTAKFPSPACYARLLTIVSSIPPCFSLEVVWGVWIKESKAALGKFSVLCLRIVAP